MIENYKRKVYYYETDRMGIVHHSNYIRWFEEARIHFFDEIGMSYDGLEKSGLWLPLVDSYCKYKSFLKYDEKFSIETNVTEYTGVRIKLCYIVYKEDGKVAAEGYTTHCFTNPDMKLLRIKNTFPEVNEKLLSLVKVDEK